MSKKIERSEDGVIFLNLSQVFAFEKGKETAAKQAIPVRILLSTSVYVSNVMAFLNCEIIHLVGVLLLKKGIKSCSSGLHQVNGLLALFVDKQDSRNKKTCTREKI